MKQKYSGEIGDLFQSAEIRREAVANATGTPRAASPELPALRKRLAATEQRLASLPWRDYGKGGLWAALIVAAGLGWEHRAWLNDKATTAVAEATGATVQRIEVTGLVYTGQQELLQALGLTRGSSLVGFDTRAARTRIEALPWVRMASVERQLPATVRMQVYEHTPLARMISGTEVWVINPDGAPIVADTSSQFQSLPLIQGAGAPAEAASLFKNMEGYPNLFSQLREAEWVGQRRWDLRFVSGVTVMLPEGRVEEGVALLQKLEEVRHVLTLNDGVVDLRLPDRIILRLPPTVTVTPVTNKTLP